MAKSRKPRGISLHIGVNECDPSRYAGWKGPLKGPENDAATMANLSARAGFETISLLTQEATRENVISRVKSIAEALEAGDRFILSYAGHGNRHRDQSGDEADGYDETWCLYDGEFFDDELGGLWTLFKPQVGVVAFMDCCHSGTMTHDNSLAYTTSGDQRLRAQESAAGGNARSLVLDDPDDVPREMPPTVSDALRSSNAEVYRVAKMSELAQITDPVRASVLAFSGCDDNEKSKERGGHGLFTTAIKEVWGDGRYPGSFRYFREDIVRRLPPSQTPQLSCAGDVDWLIEERPFALGPATP